MESGGIVLLLFGLAIFGYRTYIAWFKPEMHYAYLEWMGDTFYSWDTKSKAIATSRSSFIFFRLAFTFFFIIIAFSASTLLLKAM